MAQLEKNLLVHFLFCKSAAAEAEFCNPEKMPERTEISSEILVHRRKLFGLLEEEFLNSTEKTVQPSFLVTEIFRRLGIFGDVRKQTRNRKWTENIFFQLENRLAETSNERVALICPSTDFNELGFAPGTSKSTVYLLS